MIFSTAPELLASSLGKLSRGAERCFFCGASCGQEFTTAEFVADSFTDRNSVASPASPFVCSGCVASMRNDLAEVALVNRSVQRPKADSSREGLQFRWFSWVVTATHSRAATPAHRELLREICLAPPNPPFAICIADGNKHQLYRTPVNHSVGRVMLNCEGSIVRYSPEELADRLELTTRLIAVVGKGVSSLARIYDPSCDMGVVIQLDRDGQDAAIYESWTRVRMQSLSELAIWLSPGKDDARERLNMPAAA